MRCSIKLTIHFFFISTQTKQLMSVYKDTHTLQRRYIFYRRYDYISFP